MPAQQRLGRDQERALGGDADYVVAIEDVRDGRVPVGRTPRDCKAWFRSFKADDSIRPVFGLCGRCDRIHADRDVDDELFATCIACQSELVEVALELGSEREAE